MAEGIISVRARQVFDSRGNPTIEAEVHSEKHFARAMAPSGASTGRHEAVELRDNSKEFSGKGVKNAVKNVNERIAPKLKGMDSSKQKEIDSLMIELDGTENKSILGANAITAVSMACCRLGAKEKGIALFEFIGELSGNKNFAFPVPQMNVLNGGKHAGLENDIQEHMIVPVGANSFEEAMRFCVETYQALKSMLKKRFGSAAVLLGDEGGFVPALKSVEERLEFVSKAIEELGYSEKVFLALDSASSEFFYGDHYRIGGKKLSLGELIDFYSFLTEKFKIVSLEDAMAEDDWNGWKEITSKLGSKTQIVGDDLLVTNIKRIQRAVDERACNALLLKVNQIGTVTESINAAKLAFENKWKVVVSHRSGETEDSFIADLAVGIGANQCKFGAPARSERNAKYNQLLRIEEQLEGKGKANYSGF